MEAAITVVAIYNGSLESLGLTGSEEYNVTLSVERAESVRGWLIESLGPGSDRVDVKGYGEAKPLVASGDRDAQAINRRVEIAIMEAGGVAEAIRLGGGREMRLK